MGAAIVPAIHGIIGWLASEGVAALIVRTILINVTLGSLTLEQDGETLYAVDADFRQ